MRVTPRDINKIKNPRVRESVLSICKNWGSKDFNRVQSNKAFMKEQEGLAVDYS